MRLLLLAVCTIFLLGCAKEKELNGKELLERTIAKHDPTNSWKNTKLNLHIQEPRISNPHRYSILELDNATNSFKLSRNRDQYISEHTIDSNGNSSVTLDGNLVTDPTLIKKYRLNPSRNIGYKKFYELLYGIPMTLESSTKEIIGVTKTVFNGEDCFKIEMELKNPMISKFWNLLVSTSTMEVKGVEMIAPDKPDGGERIYFGEVITVNSIKIPRIRHWHEFKSNTYSGSDLIIKVLE